MAALRPLALTALCLALTVAAAAQVPEAMNYQVMLTDDADQPLANQMVSLIFRIFSSEIGGSPHWTEPRDVETNSIGVVSLVLGEVNPIHLDFSGPLWLEVEVDGEILSPRRPLVSAPYARRAHAADFFGGQEAAAYVLDTDLSSPGVVNDPSNPVDWSRLKSIPGGFADGTDDIGTGVGGSGTTGYVPKFTGATTVGNSAIYEAGGRVAIGTTTTDSRVRMESDAVEPVLSVANTSSSVLYFPELHVERTESTAPGAPLLMLEAPVASTGGLFFDCVRSDNQGSYTTFWVNIDGGIYSIGGAQIYSYDTETIRATNAQADHGVNVIESVYEGFDPYDAVAVYGESKPVDYYGIGADFVGGYIGATGRVDATGAHTYYGLRGLCSGGTGQNYGVYGSAVHGAGNFGVYAYAGGGSENWAGYFDGNVRVTGSFVNPLGGMEIDHPVDPENSYLRHAYVASDEMKTVYDGTVVLDASGRAEVVLPDWVEALSGDFRYQLTPIGAPAPGLYIAEPVRDSRFRIAGGEPGMTVSWMVTGVRRDAAAKRSPIVVEEEKRPANRGRYVSPVAHDAPRSMGIGYVEPKKAVE